jgi:hypothetical protein
MGQPGADCIQRPSRSSQVWSARRLWMTPPPGVNQLGPGPVHHASSRLVGLVRDKETKHSSARHRRFGNELPCSAASPKISRPSSPSLPSRNHASSPVAKQTTLPRNLKLQSPSLLPAPPSICGALPSEDDDEEEMSYAYLFKYIIIGDTGIYLIRPASPLRPMVWIRPAPGGGRGWIGIYRFPISRL